MPVSSLQKDNGLNIGDFSIGDYVTHDQYGLGKVVDLQDKGRNSVITIDFGSDGVKRLMLRVAPITRGFQGRFVMWPPLAMPVPACLFCYASRIVGL